MSGRRFGSRLAAVKTERSRAQTRALARPRVEFLEDRQLLATFTVTNTQDLLGGAAVAGSLRDAIQKANANGGPDTINFQIAGTGVHTINVGSPALPTVTDAVLIDGTTQPGYAGSPVIEISGLSSGAGANGLTLQAGGIAVKALAINQFSGSGIRVNASGDTIQLCFVGTNASGTQASPNGGAGIFLNNASGTIIGGFANNQSLGNLLTGNSGAGLNINGTSATNNVIQGNFIGTDPSGNAAGGNGGDGIIITGGGFNQIGGLTTGAGNVISGNKNNGITIIGSTASNNLITGNFIGTNGNPAGHGASGTVAVPNGNAGIDIQQGASHTFVGITNAGGGNIISGNASTGVLVENGPNTTIVNNIIGADITGTKNLGNSSSGITVSAGDGTAIGGTLDGAPNVIAFNGSKSSSLGGVLIDNAQNVPILSNSIFSNIRLGIQLNNGSNNGQVAPVLTQVATAAGRTLIRGSLLSLPNTTFTIQFFSNPTAGSGNLGQGQTLIGQTQVTTGPTGFADINVTIGAPTAIGDFVSATATDNNNNTSGFASDVQVTKANQASLSLTMVAAPPIATLGADLTYTITVTNGGPDAATNIQYNQIIPNSLTYKSSSVPPGVTINSTPTGLNASIPLIPSGTQVVFTVTVTPTVVGTVSTSATVTSNEIDPNSADNSVTVNTVVNIPANLNIKLSSTPPTVTVGQNVSIWAFITNNGPGVADDTVAQIVLPSNVSFVSAAPGQGTVSFVNGVVTANLGTVELGGTVPVQVTVTAPIDVPQSGGVDFSASVSSTELDPDTSDNATTLSVAVEPSTDLVLTLTATPDAVLSGQNVTYTYTIVNNGPSPATGVILTDPVPAGVNFIAAPPPSQGTASFATDNLGNVIVTVNVGDLAPGASATGTIVLEKDSKGRIDNAAKLAGLEPDPDPTNNNVTVSTLVDPVDLSAQLAAVPDPASIGSNLTYTITISNAGPASATNAMVIDTLPNGVTYVSGTSSQGTVSESDGVVTVSLGTLAAGASVPVTIVVVPTASGLLSNSVVASSDQTETDSTNNTASISTFVNPADLGLQMTTSTTSSLPGDPITFTAFVTNNSSTFTATNVSVSDLLPTGLKLVSATASQGVVSTADNSIVAALGTLLPGASATVTIVASATTEGTFTNSATVTSDEVDPNQTNNSDQATVSVTNGPGVLTFATPTYSVAENAGVAVITLTRSSGNLGAVTVHFSTSDGTGVSGINYKETSGTLTFKDGELSQSFTIPLIDDGIVNGATTVNISLTNPTGGATLGANAAATLVITESDFDLTGPTVTSVEALGAGKFVTGVVIGFNEALDPARASDPNNYTLFAPTKRGGYAQVGVLSPTYNAANHTVTLTSSRPLPLNTFFRVGINGSSSTGVADIFDNLLQGTGSGNGQDLNATFARGTSLKYFDHDGDFVTINITNGGVLDLYRSANGDGQILTVVGAGSRRSVLSGNVKRGVQNSDGVTTLESIVGANFGRVTSRLTTPKFYVNEVTTFIKGSATPAVNVAHVATASHSAKPAAKLFARKLSKHFTHGHK